MANCDNTSNDSGNLGVGPGVPNPNIDSEILKPEQNIPPRESYKLGENFLEPDNKAQKGIRTLGSFGTQKNKNENDLTLPTGQRIKNEQEIQQAIERRGKDEAEPQMPISSTSKIDEKITQIKDSETKKSVDIASTETRPNKNLNEISISSDSKLKELNSINIKSDSKKDEQEVLESENRDIKIGDQIDLVSSRQIKDSSITITGEKNFKKDEVVEDTNTHEKKDSPSMEVSGANGNQVKVENDINTTAPVVNDKFFNEKDLNVVDIFKNSKKDEVVNVHDSTGKKSESDLGPEEDHTLKFEMDIPSTISVNKTEEEIAGTIPTEKTEEEIADTTSTEKTEEEIADTTSTEKTEEEIADTTSTEKDLQEIADTISTEKDLQEIADTISTEKDLQEIEEATASQGKPTDVQITTEASSSVNASPITILEAETGGSALSYNVNTPASEQIIENDYDTTSVLRNKDVADNSASRADSEGNVTFIDENGNVNTTIRKIKDSTNTVSALASAGFNPTTTNGEIDTELYDNAVKVLYEDNVLSSNYSTNNNANKNYEYELNTNIKANREIESNEGLLEKETLKQETTTDTHSKIGDVLSDPDQRNERYDYTELENDGQVIKGSGDAIGARDFKSIDVSSDGIINQELYPNDPVNIPESANVIDKNISNIYHENFIYDDFGNERNTDISSESNVGLFDSETPKKEVTDPTNQLNLEKPNDQLQNRPEYVGDNNTNDEIKGIRDNKLNGITNENIIHSNYEASIKIDNAVLNAGEERESGQENTNHDYSNYISSRNVENDFIDTTVHEQNTPRKTVVPPNNIIGNTEPLTQLQDRSEYVGDNDINDRIKGVRDNKLDGITNENIIHSNYESEYKINEAAQFNAVTTDDVISGQDKSNFNYDSVQIKRPYSKLSESTINSESFVHGVTQTDETNVVYQDDDTDGYTGQVNVQDVLTVTRLDRNVEYTLNDIDKTKLKIDATTVNSEGDITDIDFNNYNQQPGDFDDGNANEYIPNRDAINYVIDDPATEDVNEMADAAIFQKQQVDNFDYTDILVKSSGKISGTPSVRGAKDFRYIGASKVPGSIATTSNQKYADLLDTKNIDYGSAKVEEAFLAEFGLETIEEWKTQGVYLENVRNKIGEVDFNLYREDNNGDYSSIQETTNFTYSTLASDGSEITIFNIKEGDIASKNSFYKTLEGNNEFGENDYAFPTAIAINNNVDINSDRWQETTSRDIIMSDLSEVDWFTLVAAGMGVTSALSTASNLVDTIEDLSNPQGFSDFSINDDTQNVLRRLTFVNAASIVYNVKSNITLEGSAGSGVLGYVDSVSEVATSFGALQNHPAAWTMSRLRAINPKNERDVLPATNVAIQGSRGEVKGDASGNWNGWLDGEEWDIENSFAAKYSSMANFRDAVIEGKAGQLNIFNSDRKIRPSSGTEGKDAMSYDEWDGQWTEIDGMTFINEWTGNVNITASWLQPTEYQAIYNFSQHVNGKDKIDVEKLWNINKDRTKHRKGAYTSKLWGLASEFFTPNADGIYRQDLNTNIESNFNSAKDDNINNFPAPFTTNSIYMAEDGDTKGTLGSYKILFPDVEKGWHANNTTYYINKDVLTKINDKSTKIFDGMFHVKSDQTFYGELMANASLGAGKVIYTDYKGKSLNPTVDNELDIDPHFIDAGLNDILIPLTGVENLTGKDLFYKELIKDDKNENLEGFKHFNWTNWKNSQDKHNIFQGLWNIDTMAEGNEAVNERMAISNIKRYETINIFYDELMTNKTNITENNYHPEYQDAEGNLGDPHLGQFQIDYTTTGGTETPIYNTGIAHAQGKDLFAYNMATQTFGKEEDLFSWSRIGSLSEQDTDYNYWNMMGIINNENRLAGGEFQNIKTIKNSINIVNFKYRGKLSGSGLTNKSANNRFSYDDFRFMDSSNQITKTINILDENGAITNSNLGEDLAFFNDDNYALSALAVNVPTIVEYDKFTFGTDETGSRDGITDKLIESAPFAQSAFGGTQPQPGKYPTITAETKNNALLNTIAIDMTPPGNTDKNGINDNSFIETDIGLIRKGGEVDFYASKYSTTDGTTPSTRNDSAKRPLKKEIKPQYYVDKEVVNYGKGVTKNADGTNVNVVTGEITKTALHGAMVAFGADVDDNNTRFVAYNDSNSQLVYTDTQKIQAETKSDFHMKIKNKLDFFLKDNRKQTLKEKCIIENYVDDLGYILVYPDSSKEYDINNNMLFTIPFQFNPELSGETRSAAWATHTAIGRTNEFLVWGNTSARSLQFKTTIAIIAPESGKDSKTGSADISFKDTYNGSNGRMNPIYDGWGQSWNETNMYKVLNAYRGLVLPVDYSTDRADTSSNIISPPVLSFTFGEDITQTRYSGVEGLVKSKWIATDVNIDARIEAGYTAKRNPRVYDITMTLKEVYGNFRSFQTHKQLISSGGQ